MPGLLAPPSAVAAAGSGFAAAAAGCSGLRCRYASSSGGALISGLEEHKSVKTVQECYYCYYYLRLIDVPPCALPVPRQQKFAAAPAVLPEFHGFFEPLVLLGSKLVSLFQCPPQ